MRGPDGEISTQKGHQDSQQLFGILREGFAFWLIQPQREHFNTAIIFSLVVQQTELNQNSALL